MSTLNIERNINKFSKDLDKDITKSLSVLGEKSVGIIKLNTPVESGRLRNSMSYTIANRVVSENPERADDVLKPNNSKSELVIGTNVIYAPSVEFLAQNGSQGFMNRSFNQIRIIAKKTIANALKGMIK